MAGLWLGIIWGLHFLLQRPTVANPELYDDRIPLGVLQRNRMYMSIYMSPLWKQSMQQKGPRAEKGSEPMVQ